MKKLLLSIALLMGVVVLAQAQDIRMLSEIKQKKSERANSFMGSNDDYYFFFKSDKEGRNGSVLAYNKSYQFEKEIILSEGYVYYHTARVIDDKTFCMIYSFRKASGEMMSRVHFYNTKGKKIEDREYEDAYSYHFSFSPDKKYMAYRQLEGDDVVVISTEDFQEVTTYKNYHNYGTIDNNGQYIQLGFVQMENEDAEDDEDEEIDDKSQMFISFSPMEGEPTVIDFSIEDSDPHYHDFWTFRDDGKLVATYLFGDEKETSAGFQYYSSEGVAAYVIDLESKEIERDYKIQFSKNDMMLNNGKEENNRFGGAELLSISDVELVGDDVYIAMHSYVRIDFSEDIETEVAVTIHGIVVKLDDEEDHRQRLIPTELALGYPGIELYKLDNGGFKLAYVNQSKKLHITTMILDDELDLGEVKLHTFDDAIKYNLSLNRALKINGTESEFIAYGHKKKNKGFAIFKLEL